MPGRAAGVEVLFFSRWLHRLHRKLLVVDERVAISGGVNIHSGAESWADLAVRVSGRRAVRVALGLFAKTYFMAGGTDPAMRPFLLRHALFGGGAAEFLRYGPDEAGEAQEMQKAEAPHGQTLKALYKEKLFGAARSIRLVTPYFAPDRWLVAALDAAVLRGVTVEILVPKKCDLWFMDRVNLFYILKMSRSSVSFFLYPKMNHAKVLLIDGREALVGSQNLDALSFNRNIESGVLVADPALAGEISAVVESWKAESEAFPKGAYRREWYDYVLAPVIRIFQPFL